MSEGGDAGAGWEREWQRDPWHPRPASNSRRRPAELVSSRRGRRKMTKRMQTELNISGLWDGPWVW